MGFIHLTLSFHYWSEERLANENGYKQQNFGAKQNNRNVLNTAASYYHKMNS